METLVDIRKQITTIISLKELLQESEQELQDERELFWHFFKRDAHNINSLGALYGTNSPSKVLAIQKEYWQRSQKGLKDYWQMYANALLKCQHSLLLFDEVMGYGLCPVCGKYVALEDVPEASLITLEDIDLDGEIITLVQNAILDLAPGKEDMSYEVAGQKIKSQIAAMPSLKRVKHEN